jgi:ADP-ribosylglycohydrolase
MLSPELGDITRPGVLAECDARLYGMIYGLAIGDALGLQAEGCSADEVVMRLERANRKKLSLPYKGSFRGYPENDWTDATDGAMVALRTLCAYEAGKVTNPETELARQIARWIEHGFSELGDTEGVGVENVTARAAGIADFITNPREAAADVKPPRSTNGALPRAVAAAAAADTPAAAADWARLLTGVTHADAGAQAASVALAVLLWGLLWPPSRPSDKPCRNSALPATGMTAMRAGLSVLGPDAARSWARAVSDTANLARLELGAPEGRTFAIRAIRTAFWAYRELLRAGAGAGPDFVREKLEAVAAQGGDASMNCAVAGAVFGAALGVAALPRDWAAAVPAGAWLRAEIGAWLAVVDSGADEAPEA